MISILLALVLFFIQIPIKTTILALKAGKGIRNNIKKNKQINEQYEDDDSLKGRLSKVGKKTSNNVGTVAKGAKETVKTGTKAVKGTIKGVKKTAKAVKTEVKVVTKTVQLLIKTLKLLLMLIKALITFLLSLGVVGIIILVVILLIFAGAVASTILLNMGEDKKSSSGSIGTPSGEEGGGGGGGDGDEPVVDTSSLEACCKTMAEWYIANIHTYQGKSSGKGSGSRTYYACSILDSVKSGATAGDDCSGFAAAYASLVAKKWVAPTGSSAMYSGSSNYTNAGWQRYTIAEIGGVSGLKVGDILVCNDGVDSKTKGHHAEIFLGTSSSFGWGKIQSKYPSSSATFTDSSKYLGYIDQGTSHRYGVIYRYTGS